MLVCSCNGVSDRKVRKAVRKGAQNAGQVGRMCGAGTTCGGCLPMIRQIVRDEIAEREEHGAPSSQAIALTTNA